MTGPKKILLVSNTAEGILRFRKAVIVDFIQKGHNVFCSAAPDGAEKELTDLGVQFLPWALTRSGGNPIAEIFGIANLYRILRAVGPDFVFFYTIKPCAYGPFVAWFLGIRSVAVITGLGYAFLNNTLKAAIARSVLGFGLFFADQVWFLNPSDRDDFLTRRMISLGKAVVLPGEGIDTDFFKPVPSAPHFAPIRFLMIGRLLRDKGVLEYIEAARAVRREHPSVAFHLVGPLDTGNPAAVDRTVIEQAAQSGDIVYDGALQDVRGAIAQAHVVVLPSYREGIPRVLLEAAAMAKPMIATDVPGCRDVVQNGVNGLLCRARDAADLARVCAGFIRLPADARDDMGARARELVLARFDQRHVLRYYEQALERKK